MSEPHLQVSDLRLVRRGRPILDGVGFGVGGGEVRFVVGASGSGKTTLLRVVAGLEAPSRGRVLLCGREVTRDARVLVAPSQRGIGFAFQDGALWEHLTVEEHLRFGLRSRGVDRVEEARRVEEALGLVQLETRRRERPGYLSGGERQRLSLARAVAHRPALLLLDEPLAHVDLKAQRDLARRLGEWIAATGTTALWVTHRLRELAFVGGGLCELAEGRVVCELSAAEVPAWLDRAGA